MNLQQLSYDTPRQPTPTIWLHYVALACGVIPLVIGTLIFLLFLATREEILAVYGALTILAGTAMAFVGLVCASVYLYQARRASVEEGADARRRCHRDILIIVVNFPTAFVMGLVGATMIHGW